ncbi:molybdenum ABC transporter permease [Accumulibacter sp.]|uniref:molybdate ABC transporter permease subunit n=1 Tax=Accumulibacter sp. TaxID=2053492 RepID=UPI0025FCE8A9|nr:ABC transporter permease subunit [Accumulibacter sp.]MCM8593986.1 ABC transporter permease subunit [Accumulibacter sp.]MCM8624803.1 ABC transporter permease subunit [Accumulibacter sp.]
MGASVRPALVLSLKVAGSATVLTLALGVTVGYLLVVLGRRGPVGAWLDATFGVHLVFTWQGAVIVSSIVAFPLVFKPARAAFESVDRQLEQAARVLGVPDVAIFFRVTLPLAWRGILAGLPLAFARALGPDDGRAPGEEVLSMRRGRTVEQAEVGAVNAALV